MTSRRGNRDARPAAGRALDRQRAAEFVDTLAIAEGTVKLHVSSILGKLRVEDRTEAVTVALQRGIIRLNG